MTCTQPFCPAAARNYRSCACRGPAYRLPLHRFHSQNA